MRRITRRLLPRELHSLSGNPQSHQPVNHPIESPHNVTHEPEQPTLAHPVYQSVEPITYDIVQQHEAERNLSEMEAAVERARRAAEAEQDAAAKLLAQQLAEQKQSELHHAQQLEQARRHAEQQARLQAEQQRKQAVHHVQHKPIQQTIKATTPLSQPSRPAVRQVETPKQTQQQTACQEPLQEPQQPFVYSRPTIHIIKAEEAQPEHIRAFDSDRRAQAGRLMRLTPAAITLERRRLASEPAKLAQFERELQAKQEQERIERERWMTSHHRKLEPPVILSVEERQELQRKREAAMAEAKRIAIEQARVEQEAKAKRAADEAAAAAEAERVRQAEAVAAERKRIAEQEARDKAAAELAKFNESRRVQELKDRELAAKVAQEVEKSVESEAHKHYDNVVITQKNTPIRMATVVQSPAAPPTPPIQPIVVKTTSSKPVPPRPATERMVPYALILIGGALLYWHFTKEPLEVPTLSDAPIVDAARSAVVSPLTAVPAPQNTVTVSKLTEKKRTSDPVKVEPVEVAPLPPVPSLPVIDFSRLAMPSQSSSARELAALQSAADSLTMLHMQQQYALLAKLQSEENTALRKELRAMIDQNAARYTQRINDIKSGVQVHVDAPMLALTDRRLMERASNDELRNHAASLKHQLLALQQLSGKPQDAAQTEVEPIDHDASVYDPAIASSRARTQTLAQMGTALENLKQEMDREFSALADRLLEMEAANLKHKLELEQKSMIDQAVEEARREERLQLKAVEADELAMQRRQIEQWATELFLEQRESIEEKNDSVRAKRLEEINAAHQRLKAFFEVFNAVAVDADQSQNLHQLSLSLLALASLVNAENDATNQQELDRMLQKGWSRLHQVRSDDPVIDAALGSIPSQVINHGLPTAHTLAARWRRVKEAMRTEAFVPVNAKSDERSFWAHLTGKIFSMLYITQDPASIAPIARSEEKITIDLTGIDLLDAMVRARDWKTIIQFEPHLSDHVRAIDRDWIAQVRNRAVTELALEAIQARVICLAAQM